MSEKKKDRTRNERQARRRAREKQWLSEQGFSSWEALHTALIAEKYHLVSDLSKIDPSKLRSESKN